MCVTRVARTPPSAQETFIVVKTLAASSPNRNVKTHRSLNAFVRDARGAMAVEFAFVAPFLFLALIFLIAMAYTLVLSETLNYATVVSSRQIATGQVQSAQLTQAQFISNIVCANLTKMFDCKNLIVNVQSVSTAAASYPNGYYSFVNSSLTGLILPSLSNSQTMFCPGNAGSYVYVQIIYPVPAFFSTVAGLMLNNKLAGNNSSLLMATATFLNEPFSAPSSAC